VWTEEMQMKAMIPLNLSFSNIDFVLVVVDVTP
jgi:hypothetical protein